MTSTAPHRSESPDQVADPHAKATDYYQQVRHEVLALVPANARRVLDVGCAEGALGAQLLERGVREVFGIEYDPEVGARARQRLTEVYCGDVETMDLPFAPGSLDCIICADVLEHLRNPYDVLKRFAGLLSESGTIVSSIPNVRHYSILHMLAEGLWTYQSQGLMDSTHLRFFTKHEIGSLFDQAGLKVTSLGANIDPAYDEVRQSLPGKPLVDFAFGRVSLKDLRQEEVVELFVIQYLITATKPVEPDSSIALRPGSAARRLGRQFVTDCPHVIDRDVILTHGIPEALRQPVGVARFPDCKTPRKRPDPRLAVLVRDMR